MLTFDCIDHTVAIFDQLFEEFAGPLQLHFITLEGLSEIRTVQIAVAKLQGRMPHLLLLAFTHNRSSGLVLQSHAAYARLPHAAHSSSSGSGSGSVGSVGACGLNPEQRRASGRFDPLPPWPLFPL